LTAQDEQDVKRWFKKYKETIIEYKIKQKNIVNFDKARFRVGCPKGIYILVPLDVVEFYALSLENQQSLTVFKVINATGKPPLLLFIVVQGKSVIAN
jgi:hypothetical protein